MHQKYLLLSTFCISQGSVNLLLSPAVKEYSQEAQLSQGNRATFLVIEYFAKSLKVIRNDTVE